MEDQERRRSPRVAALILLAPWCVARPIDPASWRVSRTDAGWRLTRHLTRDLWQVVECALDGSRAFDGLEVGPEPLAAGR